MKDNFGVRGAFGWTGPWQVYDRLCPRKCDVVAWRMSRIEAGRLAEELNLEERQEQKKDPGQARPVAEPGSSRQRKARS